VKRHSSSRVRRGTSRGFRRLAKLAEAVEKWLEEGKMVEGRSADRLFAGASVFQLAGVAGGGLCIG